MDYLGGVKEIESHSWGMDSFRGIAPLYLMDGADVYSLDDPDYELSDNPDEYEGCFKENPTTVKSAHNPDGEEIGGGDEISHNPDMYTPGLMLLSKMLDERIPEIPESVSRYPPREEICEFRV